MIARLAVVVIALIAPACADEGASLGGSVSEYYPLGFDEVRARLYSSELAIEYVSERGETVVRLTVRRAELDPSGPTAVDLGVVGDITGSADGAELPPFVSGQVYLDDYRPRDGALVAGRFDALLANGAVKITLFGTFTTRLDVVDVVDVVD